LKFGGLPAAPTTPTTTLLSNMAVIEHGLAFIYLLSFLSTCWVTTPHKQKARRQDSVRHSPACVVHVCYPHSPAERPCHTLCKRPAWQTDWGHTNPFYKFPKRCIGDALHYGTGDLFFFPPPTCFMFVILRLKLKGPAACYVDPPHGILAVTLKVVFPVHRSPLPSAPAIAAAYAGRVQRHMGIPEECSGAWAYRKSAAVHGHTGRVQRCMAILEECSGACPFFPPS
jgi:hypothetical protein